MSADTTQFFTRLGELEPGIFGVEVTDTDQKSFKTKITTADVEWVRNNRYVMGHTVERSLQILAENTQVGR